MALLHANYAAMLARHWFCKETGNRVCALAQDHLFQFSRKPRGELRLRFAWLAFSPIMRTGQMQKAGQRQAEDRVIGLAGHRGRDRRDAMVGILAGNNFASLIMAF